MKKSKEIVAFEVPAKTLHITHAKCQNGCDIMDASVQIGGFPSILAKVTYKNRKGKIHIDPVYGSFENIWEFDVPDGEIVELHCPKCGVSLTEEPETCNVCTAPMFALQLAKGAIIEACLRKGCFEHMLKLVKPEDLLKRLFDEHMLDAYL